MKKSWFLFAVIFAACACSRVKRKGQEALENTKETISEKKADLADKIVAHYDPYHPDTKFNRKRFEEFFRFEPKPPVRNIYCYADEMGIDHSYQFSFDCNSSIVHKIAGILHLEKQPAPDNFGNGLWQSFPWWDSATITRLKPWSSKSERQYYKYLWFDASKQKAYYHEFDL